VTHGPLTHVDATIGEAVCPFTIHPESKQTPYCTSTVRTLYKSLQTPSSICKLHMLHDESALMTMTSGRSFYHLQSSDIAWSTVKIVNFAGCQAGGPDLHQSTWNLHHFAIFQASDRCETGLRIVHLCQICRLRHLNHQFQEHTFSGVSGVAVVQVSAVLSSSKLDPLICRSGLQSASFPVDMLKSSSFFYQISFNQINPREFLGKHVPILIHLSP
jgi:hypothetical protein